MRPLSITLFLALCFIFGGNCLPAVSQNVTPKESATFDAQASLKSSIATYEKLIRSKEAKDQTQALENILPLKKDLDALFPDDAELLWKQLSVQRKFFLENSDKIAAGIQKRDALPKMTLINVRTDKKSQLHEMVLTMIPKNIPVYRVQYQEKKQSYSVSSYIYVNKRWILIKGFDRIPTILERIKKRAEPKAEPKANTPQK